MRTFAIVNRKGGVGKTTTAVNLAYVLATSCHLRVLLVDADGQANATQILLPRGEYDGLGALMRGMAICYDELVVHTDVEGLDVLPASEDLWALDLEAAGGEGGRSYRTLRDMGEAVEEDGAYDVMVIDCPAQPVRRLRLRHPGQRRRHHPRTVRRMLCTGVADLMEQIDSLRYIRPGDPGGRGAGSTSGTVPRWWRMRRPISGRTGGCRYMTPSSAGRTRCRRAPGPGWPSSSGAPGAPPPETTGRGRLSC